MFYLKVLILVISYKLTCCSAQSYNPYRYPAQRRAGYSYESAYKSRPNSYYTSRSPSSSYYSKPKSYYASGSGSSPYSKNSYSSTTATTLATNRYTGQRGYSTGYRSGSAVRGYSPSPYSTQSSSYPKRRYSSPTAYSSSSSPVSSDLPSYTNSKDYLNNSYNSIYKNNSKDHNDAAQKNRISKADAENAKFVGASNQEDVQETGRTSLHLKRRKLLRQGFGGRYGNPCFPYGRDAAGAAGKSANPSPKRQGRILWDVNVYNVYPQTSAVGCGGGYAWDYQPPLLGGGGFGGGYGGGGLLSDPIVPARPTLNSFLGLWAPGILQNALAVTARPYADYRPLPDNRPLADNQPSEEHNDDLQSDPDVDPNYRPAPPVRRPNRIYFDSAGAAPVTPAQLIGGVATTVNGIIQQLTGNVQPVYG